MRFGGPEIDVTGFLRYPKVQLAAKLDGVPPPLYLFSGRLLDKTRRTFLIGCHKMLYQATSSAFPALLVGFVAVLAVTPPTHAFGTLWTTYSYNLSTCNVSPSSPILFQKMWPTAYCGYEYPKETTCNITVGYFPFSWNCHHSLGNNFNLSRSAETYFTYTRETSRLTCVRMSTTMHDENRYR